MSKLIFNPEKYMKELEKYGFEYFSNGCGTYGYTMHLLGDCEYITIVEKDNEFGGQWEREIPSNMPSWLLYKLIKANLIIDEEELNEK